MKKPITIILILLLIVLVIIFLLPERTKTIYLKEHELYKDMKLNNIKNIEVIKFTEGGDEKTTVDKESEIKSLYGKISNIKIGEETNMACEDNTTVYTINYNDESSKTITIECDWVIIGNKRYLIK